MHQPGVGKPSKSSDDSVLHFFKLCDWGSALPLLAGRDFRIIERPLNIFMTWALNIYTRLNHLKTTPLYSNILISLEYLPLHLALIIIIDCNLLKLPPSHRSPPKVAAVTSSPSSLPTVASKVLNVKFSLKWAEPCGARPS